MNGATPFEARRAIRQNGADRHPRPNVSSPGTPLSASSSPPISKFASPLSLKGDGGEKHTQSTVNLGSGCRDEVGDGSESEAEWADEDDMSRLAMHRPTDGRSQQPLLNDEARGRPSYDLPPDHESRQLRRPRLRSKSPAAAAKLATRKKYTYAGFFLVLSLISFVVQTETAVHIQHELGWKKAYCML